MENLIDITLGIGYSTIAVGRCQSIRNIIIQRPNPERSLDIDICWDEFVQNAKDYVRI